MQRLLPEMPRFKTHPIFAKESEVVDSKGEEEEQDHSHDKLEHSYGTPLIPQQPLVDPTVEPEVDHSITNSLLSRDSDHEVLDEEKPLTTETSGMLEFQGPAPCMADGLHKPVLIPLTMDTAMNSFPVRVSYSYIVIIMIVYFYKNLIITIARYIFYRSPSAKVPCGLTI